MDILLGVALISAILIGCQFLLNALLYPQALGRRSVRYARHSLIARQAMQDIDRKYEELLRS
jgi:hypothetical protein